MKATERAQAEKRSNADSLALQENDIILEIKESHNGIIAQRDAEAREANELRLNATSDCRIVEKARPLQS